MVWRYAESGFPLITYVTNTIGYFVSFGIILVVPIDIATVIFDRRSIFIGTDQQYNDNIVALQGWYSFFFSTIIVLGFVLVFEEYFNTDGYFTVGSKLWSSFKRMFFDTILMVGVGAIILYILIQQKIVPGDSTALQLTAVIVTNTVYETFLMFLLGYGLVEFPRTIWRHSDLDLKLKEVRTKAASDFKDIGDAYYNISKQVANSFKTNLAIGDTGTMEIRQAIEIILGECPEEFRSSYNGEAAVDKKTGKVTIDTLGKLRTELKFYKTQYRMAQAKVEGSKLAAYELEDIINARDRNTTGNREPVYDGIKAINWSLTGKPSSEYEYDWQITRRPILLKVVAVCFSCLSIFSFIGVMCSMNFIPPKYSVYNNAVESKSATQGGIVIFILFTLGYVVYVTMWSLFQLKFAGLMDLVPGRTTPDSLSFNVRMVSKLAAPLVFFYLGWIFENGLADTSSARQFNLGGIRMPSAFSHFYQLQDVKIIKQTFGTLFPLILLGFTFLSITNLYNWICVKLGLTNWQFGNVMITEEQMREGDRQLQKSKKKSINDARRQRFRSRLLRMVHLDLHDDHEEDGLDHSQEGEPSGFWASICGKKQGAKSVPAKSPQKDPEVPELETPNGCCGIVAVKGGKILTSWTDYFVEVRAPGFVHFFLNRADADTDKPAPDFKEPIDLMHILDFKVMANNQLVLHLRDKTITLRFSTDGDNEVWKRKLVEWKDFNKDHGLEYMKRNSLATRDALDNIRFSLDDLSDEEPHAHKERKSLVKQDAVSSASISNSSSSNAISSPNRPSDADIGEAKPNKLEGYVELKGHTTFGREDWHRVHLRVDEKSRKLNVCKTADPNNKPDASYSLPSLSDVEYYTHNGKTDYKRFGLTDPVSGKPSKFRVQSDLDGKKWVEGLEAWKDWCLMNYNST